jgi:hypothetical protein
MVGSAERREFAFERFDFRPEDEVTCRHDAVDCFTQRNGQLAMRALQVEEFHHPLLLHRGSARKVS